MFGEDWGVLPAKKSLFDISDTDEVDVVEVESSSVSLLLMLRLL